MSFPRPLLALTAAAVLALGLSGAALPPALAPGAAPAVVRTTAAQLPTDEQLKAALLTAAELGPDFTEAVLSESPSPGGGASPVAGCDALRALLNRNTARGPVTTPHQEAEFDGPNGNPMVTESLTAEEPARLTGDFKTVSDAFADCRSITFNDDTGTSVTFTVTPVALGDRQGAPAVRLDGAIDGIRLNGYLGVERLGDVALAFGFFQRDSDSSQLASLYYRAAVAKAERTLGAPAGSTTAPTAPVNTV
ncbi:hypothetical protein [Kitasatospora sp. NPDC093806]|uniref:hypothetical protein n=1 Tax=Kitasatospora sp. NPDC093806 TaxID=3155075 RepID=UPI00343E055E